MADLDVTGPDIAKDAQRLRDASRLMRQRFQVALDEAASMIIDAARTNALRTLPKRGGLNVLMSRSTFTVAARHKGIAGIRIETADHDKRIDSVGRLRHPVYGNRQRWVEQRVTSGWFTNAAKKQQRKVGNALDVAAENIAKEIGA